MLRAPRLEDAKTVAALANDRRIAENTARIPHPYKWRMPRVSSPARTSRRRSVFLITLRDGAIIGACGFVSASKRRRSSATGWACLIGAKATPPKRCTRVIDYAFTDLGHEALQAGARVTNPASRRVLEKCGFQWTGVGLYRIRAIKSSAPIDRFRLERGIWSAIKGWGRMKKVM